MKIVFFGSANVALPILEELVTRHEVLAVVTNPDAPAGRRGTEQETPVSALAKDLNLKTFKPKKIKGNIEFFEDLQNLSADIFVVVAFGSILPKEIIKLPKLKTVNVHFSLLPKYRGPSPIQSALLHGDKQTGTSIFLLDEHVDSGPLLAQKIINIVEDDNFFTLSDKLAKISAHLLLDTLGKYQTGKVTPLPQDEAGATYTKIITKEDGKINWQNSAFEIYNQFRAFYIWPGIWTFWKHKNLKILDCVPSELQMSDMQTGKNSPGQVLETGKVICGNGTILKIRSLKLEGKKETDIASFLNGHKDFVQSKLG